MNCTKKKQPELNEVTQELFLQGSSFSLNNGKTALCLHIRRGRLNWVRVGVSVCAYYKLIAIFRQLVGKK